MPERPISQIGAAWLSNSSEQERSSTNHISLNHSWSDGDAGGHSRVDAAVVVGYPGGIERSYFNRPHWDTCSYCADIALHGSIAVKKHVVRGNLNREPHPVADTDRGAAVHECITGCPNVEDRPSAASGYHDVHRVTPRAVRSGDGSNDLCVTVARGSYRRRGAACRGHCGDRGAQRRPRDGDIVEHSPFVTPHLAG